MKDETIPVLAPQSALPNRKLPGAAAAKLTKRADRTNEVFILISLKVE